nr:MAG TPA: hypothetical protein [Bacteriophage sp.]
MGNAYLPKPSPVPATPLLAYVFSTSIHFSSYSVLFCKRPFCIFILQKSIQISGTRTGQKKAINRPKYQNRSSGKSACKISFCDL